MSGRANHLRSVCLRLVRWLQRLLDQFGEYVAKDLRVDEPHAVSGDDAHLGSVRSIGVNSGIAQAHNAIGDARLRDKIAEYHRSIAVQNLGVQPLRQAVGVAAFNNHIVGHFPPSQCQNNEALTKATESMAHGLSRKVEAT